MTKKELRTKIVAHHHREFFKIGETIKQLLTHRKAFIQEYGRSEYDRLLDGVKKEAKQKQEYTNAFLKNQGLKPL